MKAGASLILATSLVLTAGAQAVAPRVSFHMVDLDPPSPATLHNNEHVYVRIQYETTAPMRVWVQFFDHGKRTTKPYTNGEALLQPGQGETLAWFAFTGAGSVDAIRLSAIANDRDVVASQDLSVGYTWDGQRSTGEARAPWVGPLLAKDEQRQKEAFDQMEKRVGAAGMGFGMVVVSIFGVVALAALAACFGWPLWGAIRWDGNWRIAAALPLVATLLWGLKDAYDLMLDRTSHNLLPFEFIIAACAVVPYMLVVTLVRHVRLKKP